MSTSLGSLLLLLVTWWLGGCPWPVSATLQHIVNYCNVDFMLFHSVKCYTKSLLSQIRVNHLRITCTSVATSVILQGLVVDTTPFLLTINDVVRVACLEAGYCLPIALMLPQA